MKGCSRAGTSPATDFSGLLIPDKVQEQQVLLVDIFFIQGAVFLLGLLHPLKMRFVEHLPSGRSIKPLLEMLERMTNTAKRFRLDVKAVQSDGESAIKKLEREAKTTLPVETCERSHTGMIEIELKTVKERQRSCSILPYLMCLALLVHSVLLVVSNLNKERPYGSSMPPPFEQMTGHQVEEAIDYRVPFGSYVQATATNTDNTNAARTAGAITCRTVNRKGGVLMYQLSTKSLITRHKFTVLPLSEEVIRMLDDTAKADFDKRKLTKTTEPVPANSHHRHHSQVIVNPPITTITLFTEGIALVLCRCSSSCRLVCAPLNHSCQADL